MRVVVHDRVHRLRRGLRGVELQAGRWLGARVAAAALVAAGERCTGGGRVLDQCEAATLTRCLHH